MGDDGGGGIECVREIVCVCVRNWSTVACGWWAPRRYLGVCTVVLYDVSISLNISAAILSKQKLQQREHGEAKEENFDPFN